MRGNKRAWLSTPTLVHDNRQSIVEFGVGSELRTSLCLPYSDVQVDLSFCVLRVASLSETIARRHTAPRVW